jgi:hypothetical protein
MENLHDRQYACKIHYSNKYGGGYYEDYCIYDLSDVIDNVIKCMCLDAWRFAEQYFGDLPKPSSIKERSCSEYRVLKATYKDALVYFLTRKITELEPGETLFTTDITDHRTDTESFFSRPDFFNIEIKRSSFDSDHTENKCDSCDSKYNRNTNRYEFKGKFKKLFQINDPVGSEFDQRMKQIFE